MRKGQDVVTANISIKGIVFWHLLYVADDGELKKNGTSAAVTPFPLGVPEKLDMDMNTWHIAVMNPTRATVNYSVSITWEEGVDTIAKWPEDGPNEGSLKSGENIVFNSSALLAILPEKTRAGNAARSRVPR
jgi:hypothetical protein